MLITLESVRDLPDRKHRYGSATAEGVWRSP